MKTLLLAILVGATLSGQAAPKPPPPPPIISITADGLHYDQDEQGNRVPDFSHAGYAGADRSIPDVPVRVVVSSVAGDSTERIQRAIDHVAALTPDEHGVRGAVLLLRGRHEVFGGLSMSTSGVVLRGQGMGEDGTLLVAAGLDRRTLIRVTGRSDRTSRTQPGWSIVDDYVPVGATSFQLRDVGDLKVGDAVAVIRPCTMEWIEALGAKEFGGGIGFGWKPGTRDVSWDRRVESIDGNQITVDAPLTTAIESRFGGGYIETYSWPGRITEVGIENLRLESTWDQPNLRDEDHSWCAITMENVVDCWVRQVTARHFSGSTVALYETCKGVTVQDCLSLAPVSEDGGYRRHTFFTMGQLTLFLRCYAENGRHDFSVGHCAAGPNAFVQCEARQPLRDSGPIESWASGVLYDNVTIDGNALMLGYRPGALVAIGWAAANSVAWQCNAAVIRLWNPPTAQNWAFGSWSGFEGDGIWRSPNNFVSPDSLYAGQLRDRLGPEAPEGLQLMPRPRGESSNPSLDRAQELAAASHEPAPLLSDYIAAAGERDPIPSDPGDAMRVEELSTPGSALPVSRSAMVLTNGWLTVGGKLLIGGTTGVQWWRGNVRPKEAPSFGLGVTRFVPGRIGPGFTDDLNDVAETMSAAGVAALDHHYGLWYDRRRDDHERVRRMDGDVWPPFYEQPFARSGQGTAWDGLSQYDLAKFNPWYWSRLSRFADVCGERGLVLFHQNYFQHNILEAGAHWADAPWRTANNVNNTGFPEPPNYAGDKRIFMAELFYDVDHPVRRELHQHYIRQCLNNFTNQANVIQFTSAEYTGPLAFVQFWIDTIAEWEQENAGGRRLQSAQTDSANGEVRGLAPAVTGPLIALSATKDVQDAILTDPKRSAIVDVIDFRYWWRTEKGLFAPEGGLNLAPRQFERRGSGGRPKDVDLARMTSEYRGHHPDKAVICNFNNRGWAFLCAGGSIPNLPKDTDQRLLSAIPRMQPWAEASADGRWVLREAGRQFLVYGDRPTDLDLSTESGSFRLHEVDPRTGAVRPGVMVQAGATVKLRSTTVTWLVKE